MEKESNFRKIKLQTNIFIRNILGNAYTSKCRYLRIYLPQKFIHAHKLSY